MRVIIADLPPLFSDILARVTSAEPDIDLIEISQDCDLAESVRRSRADVVVTAASQDCGPVVTLLETYPHLRVIAIGERGRTGWLWELRPHRESLGELTVAGLNHALRRPRVRDAISLSKQE